jgi:hypothetical protein
MVVHKIGQAHLLARNQNRAQAERRTEKHACLSHAYSMPHMFFFVKRVRKTRAAYFRASAAAGITINFNREVTRSCAAFTE